MLLIGSFLTKCSITHQVYPSKCNYHHGPTNIRTASSSCEDIQLLSLPYDAKYVNYVGDWKYWYRENGMQTSSDDVLVALISSLFYYDLNFNGSGDSTFSLKALLENIETYLPHITTKTKEPSFYIDMGCGIGSSLFLVSNKIRPKYIYGIEAQEQSHQLTLLTATEIMKKDKLIKFNIIHDDIRNLRPVQLDSNEILLHGHNLYHTCDLITANPPYLPYTEDTQSVCTDLQRRYARFEYRGGINDYCVTASYLLSAEGRMVVSYWYKDNNRVYDAVEKAGLRVSTRIDVLMGAIKEKQESIPIMSIFIIQRSTISNSTTNNYEFDTSNVSDISSTYSIDTNYQSGEIITLDLRFQQNKQAVTSRYKIIQNWLQMHSRPLKRIKVTNDVKISQD